MFIGRTDIEAETPILWAPAVKSWLIGKDPDAGTDWGQEEKGMTEDEMVGWHHQHNGHGFGWTPGVGDGQGGLRCCSSWGHKESETTEQLSWIEHEFRVHKIIILNYFFSLMYISTPSSNGVVILTRIWFYGEFHSLNCIFPPLREPSLERKVNKQSSSWLYDWDAQYCWVPLLSKVL